MEYYGTLKGMTKEEIDRELDKWLERFGISEYKDRKIKELSKETNKRYNLLLLSSIILVY